MKPAANMLTVFNENPSPATALALAIADHTAGPLIDWPFVQQLRKAEEQVAAHPKLVAALLRLRACLNDRGGLVLDPASHQFAPVVRSRDSVSILAAVDSILKEVK